MPVLKKQFGGHGHNRFEPVVLDDPLADVALAAAGIAGEEGRPVEDDGDSGATDENQSGADPSPSTESG